MDLLDDLLSTPFDGLSTVEGEASDESEEGEDIGDLGDIEVTPITSIPVVSVPVIAGEVSDESEEGEDIGDIIDEIISTPIHAETGEADEEEEEGEDIGLDVEDLVATPIVIPEELFIKEITPEEDDKSLEQTESQTQETITPIAAAATIEIPKEAFGNLSTNFLETYKGPLAKMHESLTEFSRSQAQILRFLQMENEKHGELPPDLHSAIALFEKAPMYQNKVESLQKEMAALTERVTRAKTRSLKLCQKKRQDDREEAAKLKKLKEKEELLTAKPAENLFYDWNE